MRRRLLNLLTLLSLLLCVATAVLRARRSDIQLATNPTIAAPAGSGIGVSSHAPCGP
jgi:hypothetical protein